MTLSIIVTHYKEPWDLCHYIFDTIEMQQGVSFADIMVTIVQDGLDGELPMSLFDKYHYPISEIVIGTNKGVSHARNAGLFDSESDYVMFCDCDDMFHSLYGLRLIMSAMEEEPDYISSTFVEESHLNGYALLDHNYDDVTFIHGKAFNRKFLMDNGISFNDEYTLHEDGYFVCLAYLLAKKRKEIKTPFYTWKWNDDSVVRKESGAFVLRTYAHLIKARDGLIEKMFEHGLDEQANDGIVKTFFDTYYDMMKPDAVNPKNYRYKKDAEIAFKDFYNKWKDKFYECPIEKMSRISQVSRTNCRLSGFLLEDKTLTAWLNHIKKDVKA